MKIGKKRILEHFSRAVLKKNFFFCPKKFFFWCQGLSGAERSGTEAGGCSGAQWSETKSVAPKKKFFLQKKRMFFKKGPAKIVREFFFAKFSKMICSQFLSCLKSKLLVGGLIMF